MLVHKRLAEYQLLAEASAPSPLAQALQAELAPVELHSAPECSGKGLCPAGCGRQRDTDSGLRLMLHEQR
eukprot:14624102-Alexandrium_andersonii.AAC.1